MVLTLGAVTASMIGVHLLTFLQARGLGLAAAVALGALVGPSQVGARVVEMAFGRHYHPIWTMAASVTLVAGGVMLLLARVPDPGARPCAVRRRERHRLDREGHPAPRPVRP